MLEKRGEHDPFTEDCIHTIQRHITRITLTIERLKNLSRPQALEKWTEADMGKVVQSAVDIVRFDPKLTGIEIEIERLGDPPMIKTQSNQIMQVLINLILNAADAMSNSGSLKIQHGHDNENDRIVVDVIDNGVGIPEEKVDLVFEPFFTTKENQNGSGLGLYVSRSIIRHHGGDISVKSVVGEGSTFSVSVPVEAKPGQMVVDGERF
jgi:two-component system NtrC family sensor kinase